MTNGKDWEESQDYLAFVASSFYFANPEDKKYARELLKKNDQGVTWTPEELARIKEILGRRKQQVSTWERELASSRNAPGDSSYREFEA